MQKDYLFTSESVSEGHPDKVCDQISDAIVDVFKGADKNSRTAIETLVTKDTVVLAGEVSSAKEITKEEINNIARKTIEKIGYDQEGFSFKTVNIHNHIHHQSADIAMGVDNDGAGDQGIMFGYAVNDNIEGCEFMPSAIHLSHKILRLLSEARKNGELPHLLPDAKSQVTLVYENDKPVRAHSIVVSSQHTEDVSVGEVREMIRPYVLQALPQGFMCEEKEFYVNPTGRFVIGGPVSDTGLTGRKIIVDTYGGYAAHGGGAFSGKDPSKVDRSAAYIARYLAKNIVASGLADKCLIQLAYAIGVAKPLAIYLDTYGTGKAPDSVILTKVEQLVDLTPKGIINHLDLLKPIYSETASYGHFGRIPTEAGHFSWEKTDLVNELRKI